MAPTRELARQTLGEAEYGAALARGAAMDDDEITEYALSELRRTAALIGEPARRPRSHQAWRGAARGNDRITRQDDASRESRRGQAPRSFQQARSCQPPSRWAGGQMVPWCR